MKTKRAARQPQGPRTTPHRTLREAIAQFDNLIPAERRDDPEIGRVLAAIYDRVPGPWPAMVATGLSHEEVVRRMDAIEESRQKAGLRFLRVLHAQLRAIVRQCASQQGRDEFVTKTNAMRRDAARIRKNLAKWLPKALDFYRDYIPSEAVPALRTRRRRALRMADLHALALADAEHGPIGWAANLTPLPWKRSRGGGTPDDRYRGAVRAMIRAIPRLTREEADVLADVVLPPIRFRDE